MKKKCNRCLETLPVESFHKHMGRPRTYCKSCGSEMARKRWRERNRAAYVSNPVSVNPALSKSFFEDTYAKMLKDRGITVKEHDGYTTYKLPEKYRRHFKDFHINSK